MQKVHLLQEHMQRSRAWLQRHREDGSVGGSEPPHRSQPDMEEREGEKTQALELVTSERIQGSAFTFHPRCSQPTAQDIQFFCVRNAVKYQMERMCWSVGNYFESTRNPEDFSPLERDCFSKQCHPVLAGTTMKTENMKKNFKRKSPPTVLRQNKECVLWGKETTLSTKWRSKQRGRKAKNTTHRRCRTAQTRI